MHAVINAVFHAHGVGAFFVPSSSPPNAKTCTKQRTPSHFPQACLAMSSLLAFLGIERVRAQASIFVFCVVGKAGYAVCFLSDGTKVLSLLPCWQSRILRFRHASVISPRP